MLTVLKGRNNNMRNYFSDGTNFRLQIKSLVLEYMMSIPECATNAIGMKQAEIFRACGLDWGEQPNASSSNQQYWIVALLRELEREGNIQRDISTKLWRLK